jgi:hypothetical protein
MNIVQTFKAIPGKRYTLFVLVYVAIFLMLGGGRFYYVPNISVFMAFPLPFILLIQYVYWCYKSLNYCFRLKPIVGVVLLVIFQFLLFSLNYVGFLSEIYVVGNFFLFTFLCSLSFIKYLNFWPTKYSLIQALTLSFLTLFITEYGRELLEVTFTKKEILDDREILIYHPKKLYTLKVPRDNFYEKQFRVHPTFGYYELYFGRKVQLVADYNVIGSFDASFRLQRIEKSGVDASDNLWGLQVYGNRSSSPLFIPEDKEKTFVFDCWGAPPIELQGRCLRKPKNKEDSLAFRYWLEAGELQNWEQIEYDITNKLNHYVR